ncbi:MAG: tRNA preQ1(34) S-adenosylmethionine ribosyltransferase-isomerase QueA [Candidatus Glassbacteria bacterium]|nr:tRNA preQ1(34) S-adenosylmethionine ribosyltransferase-isomerase QueA [Candidatus Glassbacteria bacterium]
MKTADFDYELPRELIAQHPARLRDSSRLLVVRRREGTLEHRSFRDLPEYVRAGDLLVINNTRVFPARLTGRLPTGGKCELLLVRRLQEGRWLAMVKPGRRLVPGRKVELAGGELTGFIEDFGPLDGERVIGLEATGGGDPLQLVERLGHVPLPPYIRREDTAEDHSRYQTIYARAAGAVAAPTAGLHFTGPLMDEVRRAGGAFEEITLHVGPGTFRPVGTEELEDHRMEEEYYEVQAGALKRILAAAAEGGRVLAVGTTTVRTLETVARRVEREGVPGRGKLSGDTGLFIYPGFEFRLTGSLLTNFHLPRSTLLMLVSAFAGRQLVEYAYSEAVRLKYRFYSYGDAMLII